MSCKFVAVQAQIWTTAYLCMVTLLQWRHEAHDVANHDELDGLGYREFKFTTKKWSKLRIIVPLCMNPPMASGFPSQKGNNAESVSMLWIPHVTCPKQVTGWLLLKPLLRRKSNKSSNLRVTGLCDGNPPVPSQRANNAETISIWWRHHDTTWSRLTETCCVFAARRHIYGTIYPSCHWFGLMARCQMTPKYSRNQWWLKVDDIGTYEDIYVRSMYLRHEKIITPRCVLRGNYYSETCL